MSDLDPLAVMAYREGTSPLDHALNVACNHIEASALIVEARKTNPGAYPIFRGELSHEATARRVIGALLDAGWMPPGNANALFIDSRPWSR